MYFHARMFCTLARLLFPWVQCQCLKPVLSHCSKTGFVTVNVFIALYTLSYVFYSHGCNVFILARTFFTLADTISPIYTMITKVWPRVNRGLVKNNLTVIIVVVLIKAVLIEGFLYLYTSFYLNKVFPTTNYTLHSFQVIIHHFQFCLVFHTVQLSPQSYHQQLWDSDFTALLPILWNKNFWHTNLNHTINLSSLHYPHHPVHALMYKPNFHSLLLF